ncbi:hypothetical protein [Flavobacterium oreochromis]|uniref:Gliding motility-associated protein GldM C-terminal domain-containing protein n=2 Tax=Flavobacterium TaxID=237 RepID=A0A246GF07_9FLAO|nr:hypothetical protein [Flavobacterium oreochromis]OWP78577.1 hypothetical protein BWG23_02125 [Flavobacterium oreochromis]OWP79311.1 hypothetical protein BWK62_03175 [Flavobacterium oreochromis]POR24701.1 hypothetical protein BWK58_07720 [Flavobacterium columnare]QYS87025.1 hypothetical protein JJC03_03375 [Flavobacterium oreochromis]
MNILKKLFLCFYIISFYCVAQDNVKNKVIDSCQITQTRQKLDGRFFASPNPILLIVNNSNGIFTTLQFGKRKRKIFMYFKIHDNSVCIEEKKIFDFNFKNGDVIHLKNHFPINCDGIFIHQLSRRTFKKLTSLELSGIKVFTVHKNYEILLNKSQNTEIIKDLICLKTYKIKK